MVKDDNYELLVLGKNGEPQPFKPLNINFQHSYIGNVSTSLTTDSEGKVYLDKLENVLTVEILTYRKWRLASLKADQWSYPPQIDTVVGSTVEIPVAKMWDSAKPDSLDRR